MTSWAREELRGREGLSEQHQCYRGYEEWKGSRSYFVFDAEEAKYFCDEMRGIAVSGRRILEIGFGFGNFLAWARAQGARVAGTEISDRALSEAKRIGVETLRPDFETVALQHRERFDVVVALDVFEHFSLDEIITRMHAVETVLRPGGCLVLRFPNGQSPFGLAPQNGDITHKTALSKDKIEQICQKMSLRTERYAGSYRVSGRTAARRLARGIRYLVSEMLAAILNRVYGHDIPWDAVVVLVMRKPRGAERIPTADAGEALGKGSE